MESLGYEIEEVAYDLSRLRDANEFDPQRAETVESRLDLIRRLERRFGPTLEDVLTAQKSMSTSTVWRTRWSAWGRSTSGCLRPTGSAPEP